MDAEVRPGETLLVVGPEKARRALLLALSGRLAPTAGKAKVLGFVVPEEAPALRHHATYVDGADPATHRHLGRLRGDLVVVDHADRLEGTSRARLGALAADLGGRTLIVAAPRVDAVADIVPHADGVVVLDLAPTELAPAASDAGDVPADEALVGGVR